MPKICHMLSLPLTSTLSIYIYDKPRVEALLLNVPHLTPDRQANRRQEVRGKANTRLR